MGDGTALHAAQHGINPRRQLDRIVRLGDIVIRAKLKTEKGRDWLYSWVKEPHRYHARTKMPDLNCTDLQAAIQTVKGTARSMGIDVVG